MGIISLIVVPFLFVATLLGHGGLGAIFVVIIPVLYTVMGFVVGVISAFVYNLVATFTGGIEISLSDAA